MGDLLGSPRVAPLFFFVPNSEVKRAWARVVLGWVTSWEVLVLHPFFFFRTPYGRWHKDGCDHTSTNAPDPIRTPKLSVLGESSTRMDPFFFSYPVRRWHKGNVHARHDGCDHTSTNAPDPIRTPKLSVLGRE
ncbi:protein NRT1/ PTR FAMILY 6.1 [Senna tora]|uniref:Protein NRT1/ PTR FAMILY 6.1 n=1 Tax=Senna tora TaxID=362788 RepID=A0A834WXI1_9FABA|nr:protein NRT1/ PTR FAMILY 6.1 [Senna tora]